ncbi:MAG: hypothetical protein FJY81_06800 [Candidatus Aminicenantes bacterium]|nr:hypothetical protein [Candidatus Aminicenantes bacterium]
MRARAVWIGLSAALAILGPPASAQFRANGYLSFQYETGGSQSDFPDGTFRGTQAGFLVTGRPGNLFSYNLEIRLKKETQAAIEEAWVGIEPSTAFGLKLGLYLVPFGKYNRSSRPHETAFIRPPLHLEAMYPASWRDIGFLAEGRVGILNYSAYLGNGLAEAVDLSSSQRYEDNNADKAAGGRVGVLLSQSFEVGFSYYRGKYDDDNSRALALQGADVTWQNDAFVFLYEYGKALIDNPEGYARGETEGHFFFLSLKVGEFSPLASYQKIKVADPFHGPGFSAGVSPGSGISSSLSRWALGLAYAPASGLLIKVEYDFNRESGFSLDNDVFLAQVALRF